MVVAYVAGGSTAAFTVVGLCTRIVGRPDKEQR